MLVSTQKVVDTTCAELIGADQKCLMTLISWVDWVRLHISGPL